MISFTDTHLHLDFLSRPQQDLALARVAGVRRFVAVGVQAEYFPRLLAWKDEPGVYLALGLHPLYRHHPEDLRQLEALLQQKKALAIGEIGLDGGQDAPPWEEQCFYFEAQLRLARQYDLPVLLHARRALDAVLHRIKKHGVKRFLLHSFSGSDVQLKHLLTLGGLVGIGGTLTYSRAQRLRRQMAQIDAASYVLETDAPDQPLNGWRGQDNLPQRLPLVAQVLAQLRGVSMAQISRESEANAQRFFHFPP